MMKDAVRNVRDLLINPYRTFMRIGSRCTFDTAQYSLYIMSVLVIVLDKKGIGATLEIICVGISSFCVGWVYMGIIRACGGELCFWTCLNAQVCIETLANIGNIFEIKRGWKVGSAISLAVNIYCIYLHVRCTIVMGNAMVKRTFIVYTAIFALVMAFIYMGFGLIAGIIISERGYIG